MRRIQIYLEDNAWEQLQVLARQCRSSISSLVRKAVEEKYALRRGERKPVFETVVGLWKDRADLPPTQEYVRALRRGSRLHRQVG